MEINTNPSFSRITDPDIDFGSSLGPGITIAWWQSKLPDQYGPGGNMAPGQQRDLRWLTRLQVSSQPLVVTGVPDINSDPGCCGVIDSDILLHKNLGADVVMAPGGSVGHSDGHGLSRNMALG